MAMEVATTNGHDEITSVPQSVEASTRENSQPNVERGNPMVAQGAINPPMAMGVEGMEAGTTVTHPKFESEDPTVQLSKYILLLATLVATVTYAAGFNPPGGVWQDPAAGRLAGDPIIRYTNETRYLVFFYCNATAFASSLVVIVLVLFLALLHEKRKIMVKVMPLQAVMVLDLVSIMGAYAAGTCRDKLATIYSSVLVTAVLIYLVVQMVRASLDPAPQDEASSPQGEASSPQGLPQGEASSPQDEASSPQGLPQGEASPPQDEAPSPQDKELLEKRLRKVLMLLATFAVSVTYVAGMSTPGGFWGDDAESGHRPGDAILKDRHPARLTVFFCCNTMAFVASLLIIVVLLNRKYNVTEAYVWITVALVSLVGAYTAGSCRETDTTVYVASLVGAVLIFIAFLVVFSKDDTPAVVENGSASVPPQQVHVDTNVHAPAVVGNGNASVSPRNKWLTNDGRKSADKARSLVLLLATLAATITYQAGLDPPGGVWPDNGDGYMAGDPILLTTNPRRYKAFFYCNSVAFVASLVAIILVQKELLLKTHVLEAAMILDLFGLIGAYAAGSCRDVSTSVYAMALAGAVLVYVVIHVVFFTLDHTYTDHDDDLVEKRRKRLLLFAVLAATITYQAGLTPPGGFLLQDDNDPSGHNVGDPILLDNFDRRYTAFFYCNSVSFMLSIALIILLVNPHLYRPAIRSYALAVCTAAGLFGLMGAYAAGSTQYLKTSIYIFVLVVVVVVVVVILFLVFLWRRNEQNPPRRKLTGSKYDKEMHAKRKYLMLLGILVASVTYQAGLKPPGGAWQSNGGGHDAGNPVLHDSNRPRYLAFFYSNSTSFVASIVVIILLLVQWLMETWECLLGVMNTAILLDLLALLGAYAAGSSRGWKTSVYVVALIIAVLGYVAIHIGLAFLCSRSKSQADEPRNGANLTQIVPSESSPT